MPVIHPYLLQFHSGYHVGPRGVNLGETVVSIPSDTLFSALVSTWRRLGEDPQVFLRPFVEQPLAPPFLISSAFPFAGKVLFFPMPLDLRALFSPQTFQQRGKTLKRIRYLSRALLEKIQAGEKMDAWLFPRDEDDTESQGVALQGGALWLTKEEVAALPPTFQRDSKRLYALEFPEDLGQWTGAARDARPAVICL